MNEEEKFDELLSSRLSERDFPFDELNWDEAERLIIQQENRRKNLRFSLIFSAGLIAGALIMLPFIISTHTTPSNTLANTPTANKNTVTQKNISSQVSPAATQPGTTISSIAGEEKEAPQPVHSAFVKKDTRTGIRGNSSNTISPVTKVSKANASLPVASVTISHNRNKVAAKSNLLAVANKSNKKPHYTGAVSSKAANTPALQSAAVNNSAVAQNQVASISSGKEEKNNSQQTVVANTIHSDKPAASNTSAPGKNTPSSAAASQKNTASTATAAKPAVKKDSSIVNMSLLRDAEPESNHDNYPSNFLSVYAGGNYSFGWYDPSLTNETIEGRGITPWAGFSFTHYFGAMSASVGAGYSELKGLNKTYTNSVIGYDFGANTSVTTVTPQVVYYIAFPLKVQFNFDSKDIIGIGGDYLLMMTTYSTLTTYKETYFANTSPTSEKQNGYTQGFNNSDIQFTFAYTRMLLNRLGISAEYYYDLGYVENNTIPGINQNIKNSGIRLVLSYQLMK